MLGVHPRGVLLHDLAAHALRELDEITIDISSRLAPQIKRFRRVLKRDADLVVCDGLLGNVALKVAEATAALASTLIAREYDRHWWSRALALLSAPLLRGLKRSLSADLHGGAFLLGLQGVVVKSHGSSSEAGFAAAIGQAALCIEHEMVAQLRRYTDEQHLVSEEKIHDVD